MGVAGDRAPARLGVVAGHLFPYGGAERFLGRLLEALPLDRIEIYVLSCGGVPKGPWPSLG